MEGVAASRTENSTGLVVGWHNQCFRESDARESWLLCRRYRCQAISFGSLNIGKMNKNIWQTVPVQFNDIGWKDAPC